MSNLPQPPSPVPGVNVRGKMFAADVHGAIYGLIMLLSVLVALYAYRYFLPQVPDPSGLATHNRFTSSGALIVHAGFAATALLVGSFQFLQSVRLRWPRVHRTVGTVYIVCCLVGGCAGLLLAFGTLGGRMATIGFAALAAVWLFCTAQAWRYALRRDFVAHRRWVIRSFSLTLAAVTLRIYVHIVMALHFSVFAAYPAISFLCWIPNLLVAQWLLTTRFGTVPVVRHAQLNPAVSG